MVPAATILRQHTIEWLDTRVPALKNKTPRQAARTARGRERLEALFAYFERIDEKAGQTGRVNELREALGLVRPGGESFGDDET